MSKPSLDGITVVSFESRMADTTARLVEKYGGRPLAAPSMQEVPLEEHGAVFEFGEALLAGTIDVVIFTTGVGTRMLFETLQSRHDVQDLRAALSDCVVVTRGPKPVRALKKYDMDIALKAPEPNTWEDVLAVLASHPQTAALGGQRVAVQEYGRPNPELNDALRARGAELVRVPIYRWALPDDLEPLKNGIRALIGREAKVAVFTSRQQVEHVLEVAAAEGWERSLRRAFNDAFVASVGPICSQALEAHDIAIDFQPERPKLGILIRGLASAVSRQRSRSRQRNRA